jgi:hypothetical protein
MKTCLWVFKIRGFEGGIRVPKRGGPLNSTGAGLLNHQTSKISIKSIWMKISLWLFKIRGFEGGIWVPKRGRPLNFTEARLLNHQTSKNSPIFAEEEEEEDTTKLGEVQELGTEILEML